MAPCSICAVELSMAREPPVTEFEAFCTPLRVPASSSTIRLMESTTFPSTSPVTLPRLVRSPSAMSMVTSRNSPTLFCRFCASMRSCWTRSAFSRSCAAATLKDVASWPTSSRVVTGTVRSSSPRDRRCEASVRRESGWVMARVMKYRSVPSSASPSRAARVSSVARCRAAATRPSSSCPMTLVAVS